MKYLFFKYRRQARERKVFYNNLAREIIDRLKINKDRPKNRLFNILKVIKPILDFLEATEIGRRPNEIEKEETTNKQLNKQDLDRLKREETEEEEEE